MKIKCPICGKNAEVDYCDEVAGELNLGTFIEMHIGCESCKSDVRIRTDDRKQFDKFLQKSKV